MTYSPLTSITFLAWLSEIPVFHGSDAVPLGWLHPGRHPRLFFRVDDVAALEKQIVSLRERGNTRGEGEDDKQTHQPHKYLPFIFDTPNIPLRQDRPNYKHYFDMKTSATLLFIQPTKFDATVRRKQHDKIRERLDQDDFPFDLDGSTYSRLFPHRAPRGLTVGNPSSTAKT